MQFIFDDMISFDDLLFTYYIPINSLFILYIDCSINVILVHSFLFLNFLTRARVVTRLSDLTSGAEAQLKVGRHCRLCLPNSNGLQPNSKLPGATGCGIKGHGTLMPSSRRVHHT